MRTDAEFAKKLYQTKISSSCSPEDRLELIRQLNETLPPYPEKLFKYRSCSELSLSSFINDEIWLSQAARFNDPHDSLLYFDKVSIVNAIRTFVPPEQIIEIKNKIDSNEIDLDEFNKLYPSDDPFIDNIYKSMNLNELINFFQNATETNILTMDKELEDMKSKLRESTYISCFSTDVKSNLMWSHYANSSTGFAIEYNFLTGIYNDRDHSSIFEKFNKPVIYPVIYSNERYDATEHAHDVFNSMITPEYMDNTPYEFKDMLTDFKSAIHKSLHWEYEQEWRLISTKKGIEISHSPGINIIKVPAALYLGSNISSAYKKILIGLAAEKNLPVFQMFVNDSSDKYELDYEKIV